MVAITDKAHKKIFEYCKKACPTEIGGLLLGEVTSKGEHFIEDAIILKQEGSLVTFDISDEEMFRFTKEADAKTLGKIIGWWHTHGDGMTFWSGVDDDTSKRLARFLNGRCVSVVVATPGLGKNLQKSERCRVDIEDRKGNLLFVDDINMDIDKSISINMKNFSKRAKKSIEKNLTERPFFGKGKKGKKGKKKKGIYDYLFEDPAKCTLCHGKGTDTGGNWCKQCNGFGTLDVIDQ